jgi:predicted 2-oxoglutarate/Fe(II)-dependent dioxygenase YbiX
MPFAHARSNRNPRFDLGSMAGRYVLLCVVADLDHADAQAALAAIPREPLDERERLLAVFHAGELDARLESLAPHRLVFTDPAIASRCGLLNADVQPEGRWLLLDPTLRLIGGWPLAQQAEALKAFRATPTPDLYAGAPIPAPVLIAPYVLEPEFCRVLIDYYRKRGGEASGVTRSDETGKTFVSLDDAVKRRSDCMIEDAALRDSLMHRIYWRLAPQIEKAFMWKPTRMERYIIARYDAGGGGYFRPHRDNTTPGTAHRRFAVTLNLNAEDYEGGDLRFPEFGSRTYRAPTGGAVVFACALLHEATPVTRGERFAFLPFLYDDAAARIREENNKYLDEKIGTYKASDTLD